MTPNTKVAIGAARQYTQDQLGGPCVENESAPTSTATVSVAVDGNGDRVGLLIVNLGSNVVYIGLSSAVSATNGIELAGSGGLASFDVRDDFTLPSRRWWCISPTGSSQLYVLEINRVTLTPT